jgi:hypothetical protein
MKQKDKYDRKDLPGQKASLNTSQTQSWQAPLEWESTIGTGELESFKTHETHDPSTVGS